MNHRTVIATLVSPLAGVMSIFLFHTIFYFIYNLNLNSNLNLTVIDLSVYVYFLLGYYILGITVQGLLFNQLYKKWLRELKFSLSRVIGIWFIITCIFSWLFRKFFFGSSSYHYAVDLIVLLQFGIFFGSTQLTYYLLYLKSEPGYFTKKESDENILD